MKAAPNASGRSEEHSSFLGQCLVESDGSHEKRDRRNKQRALVISIVVQILIVAALVIFPLFSKGENIASRVATPIPPYAPGGPSNHHVDTHSQPPPPQGGSKVCHFCVPHDIPPTIVMHDPTPPGETTEPTGPLIPGALPGGDRSGVPGGIQPQETHVQPPSQDTYPRTNQRQKVSEPVQQAMLIHRVEPSYPIIAIQTRREGRVQLHAIISSDGTIQSLEVVSGEPMFIRSATSAVREWRYRPTILNGQAVEVETYITVIYTLSH